MAEADITDEERQQVVALVEANGLAGAAELLQLSAPTIIRMLPPLKVKPQTALWVRARLELLASSS